MSVPLLPTAIDNLGRQPFSFYPAVVGIEHNEWIVGRSTWSEVQVSNAKTGQKFWVPRSFLQEVSSAQPSVIIGLTKELECREGVLLPHNRRVIEMPRAVNGPVMRFAPLTPAPVVAIRVEQGPRHRMGGRVIAWIAAGILACVAAVIAMILIGGNKRVPRVRTPRAAFHTPGRL